MDDRRTGPVGYLESNDARIVEELLAFLRIPSVSTDPEYRDSMTSAAEWVQGQLRSAGPFRAEIMQTAGHPAVYAEWLGAPGRPTVLVYGHYDVQPPDPLAAWQTPPFEPEIRGERIYARGASDDKGPMFIPIKVAEAFFATEGRLPLNVKLLLEGEEEIGSPSLERFVHSHGKMLSADFALSADGAMWRVDLPSVTTASRGLAGLNLALRGPIKDLHSGRHGGSVQNPLHALVTLLATLYAPDGRVAVDGFYDDVVDASPEARASIASLPFDEDAYRTEVGVRELVGEPGYGTLERQWIRPTLEINGVGGGYQGPGIKTVIPSTAQAKITCRLVPDQDPDRILDLLEDHLRSHLPPGVQIKFMRGQASARPYQIPANHPGLQIARTVLRDLSGVDPRDVMIGGTLPVSEIFARVLGIDTVFFSFSTVDEDFHAPNEFFRLQSLRNGLRAWTAYWRRAGSLTEVAAI